LGINQNQLKPACSFRLYETVSALPGSWEALASDNIFLSVPYLEVLEQSAPKHELPLLHRHFDAEALCGIAVAQFLNLNKLDSFGNRDQCLKTMVRDFVFRNFASHVLFIGNNMLTGQHAFVLARDTDTTAALLTLRLAAAELRKSWRQKAPKYTLPPIRTSTLHRQSLLTSQSLDTITASLPNPTWYCKSTAGKQNRTT
jgi:hypothetical protein